jgi:diguanylate cyclase (GGDEF)-like protein
MIIEFLFILLNDIPNITNPAAHVIWNDCRYFIAHLLLLSVSAIGLILIKILAEYEGHKFENVYNLLIPILTILLLSLMAVINGLDQTIHKNIGSVFIANLIIFSAVILLKFPLNLTVYSIPFLTYLGGLVVFQHNVDSLLSNSINGLIFFFAAILISTVIYNCYYQTIAENIVLEETIAKLDYMSNHDPLTELLNRRSFKAQVDERMKIINEGKKTAALILMDIDHFKHVNDKFGHPIGDIAIKEVSHILIEHIRTDDLATRWGGEEFLIFLSQASIDEAYALAENIRLAIQNKIVLDDESQIKITASFGVSLLEDNYSDSFDTSYKAADTALYRAKNQGRNKVMMASSDAKNHFISGTARL